MPLGLLLQACMKAGILEVQKVSKRPSEGCCRRLGPNRGYQPTGRHPPTRMLTRRAPCPMQVTPLQLIDVVQQRTEVGGSHSPLLRHKRGSQAATLSHEHVPAHTNQPSGFTSTSASDARTYLSHIPLLDPSGDGRPGQCHSDPVL
jgi:hypothetical protein